MYRELPIENKLYGRSGIVDVIHRDVDDEYKLTDYKTGKPKYYHNYLDRININIEIGEYYLLMQDGAMKVTNNFDRLEKLDIDVKYSRLLYLRDWKNTCEYVRMNTEIIDLCYKKYEEMIDCINTGRFYRKYTVNCGLFCEYYNICKNSEEVRNRFSHVNKDLEHVVKPPVR